MPKVAWSTEEWTRNFKLRMQIHTPIEKTEVNKVLKR